MSKIVSLLLLLFSFPLSISGQDFFNEHTVNSDSPFEYARLLIRESLLLANNGKYDVAMKRLKEVENVRKELPKYSTENLVILWELHQPYRIMGLNLKAAECVYKAQKLINSQPQLELKTPETPFGELGSDEIYLSQIDSPLEFTRFLIKESFLSYNYGEKTEAKQLFKAACKIKKEFPPYSSANIILLAELYVAHLKANQPDDAREVLFEIQDLLIKQPDIRHDRAIQKALDSFDEVGESKLKKLLRNESPYVHSIFLINESKSASEHGETKQARAFLKKANAIRKTFPKYSRENISLLWESAPAYALAGKRWYRNTIKARKLINKKPELDFNLAVTIYKNIYEYPMFDHGLDLVLKHYKNKHYHADFLVKRCTDYILFYGYIPIFLIDDLKQAIEIYQHEGMANTANHYKALFLLGQACMDNYYFEDAILVLKSIPNPKSVLELYQYFYYLTYLIQAYTALEDYEEAEKIIVEAYALKDTTYELIGSIGNYHIATGNYTKAENHYGEFHEIASISEWYTEYLHQLGEIYQQQKKEEKALNSYQQAEKIRKKFKWRRGPAYIKFMENHFNFLLSNYPEKVRKRKIESILKHIKKTYGSENMVYATFLNPLGRYYQFKNNPRKAQQCFMECMELINKTEGDKHSLYKVVAQNLAQVMDTNNQIEGAISYYNKAFQSVKETIFNGFTFLPVDDKELFLNARQTIFNDIKDCAFRHNQHPAIARLCYDTELFHKNLLLTSSSQVRDAIVNSGDSTLIQQWNSIQHLKEQVLLHKIKKDDKKVAELTPRIQLIEQELTRKSSRYRIFKNEYNHTWMDVRNSLQEGEAAIEYAFCKTGNNEIYYYALLLRKEYTSPKIMVCCSEKELQQALTDSVSRLYPLVWQPLEKELERVEHIYISSAGLIHHIPFAALKNHSGNYLIDEYELHHVLSTRELITTDRQNEQELQPHIALFGGIKYTITKYEAFMASKDQDRTTSIMRSLVDSLDLERGTGFDDLHYSKKEVDSIANLFSSKGWRADVYSGMHATERNFKALSSQSPPIIHLSTHGFYFKLAPENRNVYRASENPLMRSGLAFAGVNHFWTSNELPNDATEDGVLSAYEISGLDLSGTHLAVLSACNTAKGDIMNNEGTYGLQRAFRLAGVKNIITTLWSVMDKETQEFMVEFYHQWTSGATLRDAFADTQRKFREVYKEDVLKWAGFVLIE